MLDTETANYSYGHLHTVMKALMAEAMLRNNSFENVLILGFGGGDAAKIIHKLNPEAHITGIEMDPAVIEVYHKYYEGNSKNLNLINTDAQSFLNTNNSNFDLIICDVFISLDKPEFTKSKLYYNSIKKRLKANGLFAQNIMLEQGEIENGLAAFKSTFSRAKSSKILDYNYLFFSS